jgi:hypothetical protein
MKMFIDWLLATPERRSQRREGYRQLLHDRQGKIEYYARQQPRG